jgi:SPP1 gp7 family putative phage head morphogenesis protein
MTPADQILSDLILHTTELLRASAGMNASVQLELERLIAQMERLILMNDPSLDKAALSALLDKAKAAIEATMGTISTGTSTLLIEIAMVQADLAETIVNGAVGAGIMKRLSASVIEAISKNELTLGAPSGEWWSRQSTILQQRFTDEMRMGLANGETLGDLIRRVRGRREFGFTDGIMQTTTARASAIVHTGVINVANAANMATWEKNADIIAALKFLATLDTSTCQVCGSLDGLTWTFPDLVPIDHDKEFQRPTLHWRCRCLVIPVLKPWSQISGLPGAGEIPVGTRASMNGQVPADTTYSGWLRQQPAATAREILGSGRYDLWKAGKLSLTEMTDQSNRPLTIAELRARAGL